MSGPLQTQCLPDRSMVCGSVMAVDHLRHVCDVKTDYGQNLCNVPWLVPSGGSSRTGSHIAPTVGDRALVNFSLAHSVIIGFFPKVESLSCNPVQIDTGTTIGDCGNRSTMQDASSRINPGRPEDMAVGDHVWTSENGGIMGLLRGGTVLLRASRLAQIIISKFDDLVRVIGRNYEVFTDAFIDASYNLKGRIYRFTGYAENHTKVRGDNYSYREYFGDVALAETHESNGFVDSYFNGVYPAANNTIRKVVVKNSDGDSAIQYEEVLDLDGHFKAETTNGGGVASIDQTGAHRVSYVHDGGTSTITQTGASTIIDHNGTSTATLNGSSIVLNQGPGSSTITLTNSSIVATFAGGGTITLDSTHARLSFGSHYININSTGIQTV